MGAPNTTTAPTTKKTFRVSLTIDGEDWGVWDRKSGGKIGGAILKYFPGGMAPQVSLPGGTQTIDTITLERVYDRIRDHDRMGRLVGRSGKARVVVKQRPLDPDGNGYGNTIVITGTLASVTPPDTDGSSDDAAMLAVEVEPDGPVVVA